MRSRQARFAEASPISSVRTNDKNVGTSDKNGASFNYSKTLKQTKHFTILVACALAILIFQTLNFPKTEFSTLDNPDAVSSTNANKLWLFASQAGLKSLAASSSSMYKTPVQSVFETSEMTSVTELTPDPEFIASEKYKKMEKYIKSKYDFELLHKNFIEKGYIIYKPDIPESIIDDAAEFTKVCDKHSDQRDFHQDRFTDINSVRDIAQSYDIRSMLAVLHGYDPYPFQTLNYPRSSMARTHSDYIHFAAHPVALMSAAWTALMDIHPDAGPVFYYENSHKLPPFNMQDFGLDDRTKHSLNYAKYQDIMTATMKQQDYKYGEAVIKKGEVLIWSANLVHGGPLAKDPSLLRLSQVTHYFFRNSNYNWAPVASDVDANAVSYYDEAVVDKKFGTEGTPEERRALSKFVIGPCDHMTKDKTNIPNPCDIPHRIPKVLSNIFEHKGEKNNDVIM
mmetsp:Transcript_41629/g.61082  ORF Transcript_41629/g.61082 Transcript_41629/m.61082 type:complete len:452 (+) Transcript_41629:114-1469(+)|eukprot:CAMPEP_0195514582 /NCGR_PEP_ID=MMETSP0794_2-20130614/5918_1 /TAXON_ID=515487 /ORGANISM="Stephanopyxis turris, Strain CCMP 815" /LENGTH=451 /DNA_ID=CAMNT_0040642843 /DNA_START=99 /DNA_END=1454 /DNA_ORIENTATION=+